MGTGIPCPVIFFDLDETPIVNAVGAEEPVDTVYATHLDRHYP